MPPGALVETILSPGTPGRGSPDAPDDTLFRLMVQATVDCSIALLDPEGNVRTWNRGAETIKGYQPHEIIGRNVSVFYPPEAQEHNLAANELATALVEGRFEGEGWRVRKDGSRFWANVVLTSLYAENGSHIGYSRVTRDLTRTRADDLARREDERILREAHAALRSVVEDTSDGVVSVGHDWIIRYANRRSAEILPPFRLGDDFWLAFRHVLSAPVEHQLRATMSAHRSAIFESFFSSCNRSFRIQVAPTDSGLNFFFSDITEEKELQARLSSEQALGERRTHALSQLAGGLAHEISNPLAIIHGLASDLVTVAESEPVPADQILKSSHSILKTADRVVDILHGLRSFGRGAAKEPLALASIEEILLQAIDRQQDTLDRHRVRLDVEIEPLMPDLLCREVHVVHTLNNLFNKALEVILQAGLPPADRWISLRAYRADERISIDITNSGRAVEERNKTSLFEPFFAARLHALFTGISVHLSRSAAQHHSSPHRTALQPESTSFRLSLPLDPTDPLHEPICEAL